MHSLMPITRPEAFEVKFYDWSDYHPINAKLKKHGQWVNHVSIALHGTSGVFMDEQSWEYIIHFSGAEFYRSDVVERAYNKPLFTFKFERPTRRSYKLKDGEVTTKDEYNFMTDTGKLDTYCERCWEHDTSSALYHYLWWYTARLLPEPTNCLTLTRDLLNDVFFNHHAHARFNAQDVPTLLKEVSRWQER